MAGDPIIRSERVIATILGNPEMVDACFPASHSASAHVAGTCAAAVMSKLLQTSVSDRVTLEGLTQSRWTSLLSRRQTAESTQHRGMGWEFAGVCDTLLQTARKPLILKRRDVRVV
jgi:hypothetical protein